MNNASCNEAHDSSRGRLCYIYWLLQDRDATGSEYSMQSKIWYPIAELLAGFGVNFAASQAKGLSKVHAMYVLRGLDGDSTLR